MENIKPGDSALRWPIGASMGILLLLGGLKHLARSVPSVGEYVFVVALAVQLYTPTFLLGRNGISWSSLGLERRRLRVDMTTLLWLVVIVLPLYVLAYHVWEEGWSQAVPRVRLSSGFLTFVVVQVCLVGFAEELFFRGLLLEQFESAFRTRGCGSKSAQGWAIVLTSTVFAMAHFVGEYHPARLATFFPALLFGFQRVRTGSIYGATIFHGLCNILNRILYLSYLGT
jgi:uncharacterized protein